MMAPSSDADWQPDINSKQEKTNIRLFSPNGRSMIMYLLDMEDAELELLPGMTGRVEINSP